MHRQIIIALLFLFGIAAEAQNIKFEGFVTDNKGVGLEMANVMAVNQSNKAMDGYSITNDKGRFQLSLKPNTSYTIKISYIGYSALEETVVTTTQNINKVFTLQEGVELEGVEIVHEMPVSIKGDTIVYNSDSFTTGTERKLEDILKKLPGVEVNADGEIEVEGKKVQKLMVEGKDFFDGDTKLGVKNIPADAVDKIQVLRNYNDNSILKGVENNQDNIAMNIKLKDGKKNFWFGDMTAGIGVGHKEERYLVNPKLFYYSPKYSLNVITNFNNIGELPLTIQDYFKFTGGFRNMMAKGGSSFNVANNNSGLSFLRNNRAKEIETSFGAANFSYNVTKSWTLSGFGIVSASITDTETISSTNFLLPNSTEVASTENRNEVATQDSKLGLFKVSSQYKPNADFQFDYDILARLSTQDENNSLLRQTVVGNTAASENIFTKNDQEPVSVNQNLSFYYTASEKNIFALEIQHLYQDEDPFYNADLATQPFDLAGYITGQQRNNLNQERFVKTNKLDTKLDYFYLLTPKSHINLTLGNTFSDQAFNSAIFQILDNGAVNNLDAAENTNDVRYRFNDVFLGMHYKLLTGKFTFEPGVSLHSYALKNSQLGSEFQTSFFRVLPDFLALYQIKKTESLSYRFAFTNSFSDINQLAEGYVFNSYRSLSSGERTLENSVAQSHNLNYNKFNLFNFERIVANVNYSRVVDAVKTRALFNNVNQISTPFNSAFADESFSAFGNYGRSFLRNYKASATVRLGWNKFNNIQVNPLTSVETLVTNESFTQNYSLSAATNYKKLPNLEIGYNLLINDYAGSVFYTDRPFARLDYYFLDSFSLVADYEFYHYYNDDQSVENEYDFLNVSLIYQKKDSKWEYKLSATNLLNTTSLNDDSFSQFATSTSQYTVQPRYFIFSLKYNL